MKRKPLVITCALLAVLVLAGLWYTRPRSWESLFGTREVKNLSGQVSLFTIDNRGVHIDSWSLTPTQAEGAAAEAIMDALESRSYRVRLGNLLPGKYEALGAGSVHIAINSTASPWVTVSIFDDGLVLFTSPDSDRYMICQTDAKLYTEVTRLVQENGTPLRELNNPF